jgi:uncharacterized protein YyaL (SSP411 family)
MLYDNAQLLELLTHAYAATGEPLFRIRIEQTIAWLQREMMLPGGAFAASLDADSEGREGKFYVWTPDEVIAILGAEEGAFFADVHDITPAGNWEGVAIPNRLASPDQLPEADEERLARARMRLLSHRETRGRPATDDKILADWNGHAIAALAFAGITLGRPDWIATATGAFRFVTESMTRDGRLAHAYREGKSVFPGLATDYGAMIKGALSLHEATQDPAYIGQAETLTEIVRTHHWDADSPSYYLSADDAEALVIRPRSIADDATASATSLMASNLIRLWHLTGNDAYRGDADAILEASGGIIVANLFATTGLLNALDLTMGAVDVVIVRPSSAPADAILAAVRRHRTPNTILSVHDDTVDLPATHPAAGKTPIDGKATAYVCRDGACSLPVTEPDALAELVRSAPVESGNP